MSAIIYIEGGGDSNALRTRCRSSFRSLLDKCGFNTKPKLWASGSRNNTYRDFKNEFKDSDRDYVAMLVDSEDPIDNINSTWTHLKSRDGWIRPRGTKNDQVLLMTTCMETWIVADKATLREHYGSSFQESALPQNAELENVDRHEVQDKLEHATRDCKNFFKKGKRSFKVLGKLDPVVLKEKLPSFKRAHDILMEKL